MIAELATLPGTSQVLGLGDMKIDAGESVLICLGLGSCLAFCAYDPVSRVGGMAHMVLPSVKDAPGREPSPKFVDCGIPMVIDEMVKLGAHKTRIVAKLTGGAQMIGAAGTQGLFRIGERNVEAAHEALHGIGVKLAASDTGGNRGRTARLFLSDGRVIVSVAGEAGRDL